MVRQPSETGVVLVCGPMGGPALHAPRSATGGAALSPNGQEVVGAAVAGRMLRIGSNAYPVILPKIRDPDCTWLPSSSPSTCSDNSV